MKRFGHAIYSYGQQHIRALLMSFQHFSHTPATSILTLSVIGVALALPFGLLVMLNNVERLSGGWRDTTEITLYLQKDLATAEVTDLQQRLVKWPQIASVRYIAPNAALKEFEQQTGIQDIKETLAENPIPPILVVIPALQQQLPAKLVLLHKQLQGLPAVESASMDLTWIERLYALLQLGQHILSALGVLFCCAVLLIVGNSIRLALQHYANDISVMKIVGANDSFVRRPFLYTGILYGYCGGVIAWTLVNAILWWLQEPATKLAGLYASQFVLRGLSLQDVGLLLGGSAALGWIGAWLVVGRQLRRMEFHS